MTTTQILVPDLADASRFGELPAGVVLTDRPGPGVPFMVIGSAPGSVPGLAPALAALPDLRVVQAVNAGVDWLIHRVPEDVTVCSATGVHDAAVSEWVVAAMLASRRRFPELRDAQCRGEWDGLAGLPQDLAPPDLSGSQVLVIGHGSIGRAVASRLAPFGCEVTGVVTHARDDLRGAEEVPELLPSADVVVVLTPLTPETHHLVDSDFLSRMKSGATLVNASRGQVVDTEALVDELRTDRIRAALDVTDPEPLPPGHPLWSLPGVMITPHVAGATRWWADRAYRFAGEQISRFVTGQPLLNAQNRQPRRD